PRYAIALARAKGADADHGDAHRDRCGRGEVTMPNRLDDLDREADQLLAEVGNLAAEVTRAKAGKTSHTQAAKPNGADEERESDKPITTAFDEAPAGDAIPAKD